MKDRRTFNLTGGYNEQGIAELPEVTEEDNGKVAVVADGKWAAGEISGRLPDPSEYTDGTVLIKVGSEWKAQSGYGYEGEPAFEPITWDGNTEGKPSVAEDYFKVSDKVLSVNDAIGGTCVIMVDGDEASYVLTANMLREIDGLTYSPYFISAVAGSYEDGDFIVPEDGTYFLKDSSDSFTLSFSAPPNFHTIDKKLLSSCIYKVNIISTSASYTCDKTLEEINSAYENGYQLDFYLDGVVKAHYVVSRYMDFSVRFLYTILDNDSPALKTVSISYSNSGLSATENIYTLTPAE